MFPTLSRFLRSLGEAPRSPHWPTVRKQFLADHPKCEACGGTANLEVHHVMPFHLYPSTELIPNNLIALCEASGKNCHFLWGHLGLSWKTWNKHVREDVALWQQRRAEAPA